MFNVQGSEIIIILLVALIVLGPEKLPDAIRRFTKLYSEVRKMSTGFQSELRNALDEPIRELRDTADLVRKNADLRDMLDITTDTSSTKPKSAEMAAVDPVIAAEQSAPAQSATTDEPGPEPADDDEPVRQPYSIDVSGQTTVEEQPASDAEPATEAEEGPAA